METVRQLVRKAGFSKEVADVISNDVRRSVTCLYLGKWSRFLYWCHEWNIDLCKATITQIADFLVYLCQKLKLSIPAIKGHRSALNLVFSLADMDMATNRVISKMISSFEKSCLPGEVHPLDWNLSLVLQSLTCCPCKPMKLSLDKHLT